MSFITADLDARTKLQKSIGYNGYFGCLYCKIEGKYVKEKHHVYFPSTDTILLRDSLELPSLLNQVSYFVFFNICY